MAKNKLYGADGVKEFLEEQSLIEYITTNGYTSIERKHRTDGSVYVKAISQDKTIDFFFPGKIENNKNSIRTTINGDFHCNLNRDNPIIDRLFTDAEKLGVAGEGNLVVYMENKVGNIVTSVRNNLDSIID